MTNMDTESISDPTHKSSSLHSVVPNQWAFEVGSYDAAYLAFPNPAGHLRPRPPTSLSSEVGSDLDTLESSVLPDSHESSNTPAIMDPEINLTIIINFLVSKIVLKSVIFRDHILRLLAHAISAIKSVTGSIARGMTELWIATASWIPTFTSMVYGEIKTFLSHVCSALYYFLATILGWIHTTPKTWSLIGCLVSILAIKVTDPVLFEKSVHSINELVCYIPGGHVINPDVCPPPFIDQVPEVKLSVHLPALIGLQTISLERVLNSSATNSDVLVSLKKSQRASADLSTVVKESQLQIKDELSKKLDLFTHDFHIAHRTMQRFDARLVGTIDKIVSYSNVVLAGLDSPGRSSISLREPVQVFCSVFDVPGCVSQAKLKNIVRSYTQIAEILEQQLTSLLSFAYEFLSKLDGLDEDLSLIHGLIVRATNQESLKKEDALSVFWLIVAQQQATVAKYEDNLSILGHLDNTRREAHAQVIYVIEIVQMVILSLENLRTDAATPGLFIDAPIEVVDPEANVRVVREAFSRLGALSDSHRRNTDKATARLLSAY